MTCCDVHTSLPQVTSPACKECRERAAALDELMAANPVAIAAKAALSVTETGKPPHRRLSFRWRSRNGVEALKKTVAKVSGWR